jgi:hypothetical protein
VNGRLVERLYAGEASGMFQVAARAIRGGLPAGLYFLAVRTTAGTATRRIAVVH